MLRRCVLQASLLKSGVGGSRHTLVWQQWETIRTRPFSTASNNSKTAKGSDDDEDLDKPIQFTTSKAAHFTAQQSLGGDLFPNSPSYQPYVVSLSVGIFLLYFLALREENDMDEYIAIPLWEKVPGLEKQQLKVVLDYNRAHKLDTTAIEKRLKELEMQSQTK